jgi:hypothetical protein
VSWRPLDHVWDRVGLERVVRRGEMFGGLVEWHLMFDEHREEAIVFSHGIGLLYRLPFSHGYLSRMEL